ncbi:MAG: TRAP transporter substrate-binding protein DctP [Bosea sp.]|uniref:TRAP transporter substrate-binding protein DctP n=1 Tax=unclassified Bosea (in: a-proteobacteria) TaxID=2653178 RepID=UPI00095B764B|nr:MULTISPECIES: TRAP transporter substrate-binding protein DctP [unclassified Bosea (in: a-proteobacteria)]MBN9458079.1 TRAP transporter substrate-binding protein DctP [Bosea sp. (in: a-proteobacteria)]OJV10587.1 MAG: C4-dicarboxylate ABC transporter substrate-binding protein [Bosea sp. 67-29]
MAFRTFAAAATIAGMTLAGGAALAQNKMELNMATPWPGGHWLDIGAKRYAEIVQQITDGRIKINVFPAGALGPALKVTETVQKGVADMGHAWPGYDWAVDRTGAIFSGWPGGPNPEEMMMWLYNGNGGKLWKEWRKEKFDVVAIPCGVLETEIFMHSHKPVRTPEDMKGLKLRTSSSWAEIAPMLGASTVVLPGSEVFSALERKVVDAIEWGGPGGNLQEGFNKVAKYVVMPGLHSPSAAHDCIFNKDVWAKIGDKDKALLETAGKATMLETYLGYAKLDVDAYKKMKENPNNEFVTVDKSLVEAVGKVSTEWAQKQSASNEWFKKVYEDQAAFLTSVKPLGEFRFAIGSR